MFNYCIIARYGVDEIEEVNMPKDLKQISFRADPTLVKKLKILAVEQETTLTKLFDEAANDLLKKYKKMK